MNKQTVDGVSAAAPARFPKRRIALRHLFFPPVFAPVARLSRVAAARTQRTVNVEIARARVATTGDGATGGDAGARGRRRNRTRGGRGGAGAGAEGGAAPRQAQAPREDRVQSQTTVFVANLPFTVDNAALLAAFKGVKAVDAQVSTRRGGRSKGFGFVLFANNADQQKGIAGMDGKQVIVKMCFCFI